MQSFTSLKRSIEQTCGKKFTIDVVKQILSIVPNFYTHRWETKRNVNELIIEIPSNIKEILEGYERGIVIPVKEQSFEGTMLSGVIQGRNKVFKRIVLQETYMHYMIKRENIKDIPQFRDQLQLQDPKES